MGRANSPIPVREIAASSDVYARGFHKGDPGGLDAVDTDLAAGNIADGVTILGKLGTLAAGSLAEDTSGSGFTSKTCTTSGAYYGTQAVAAGADYDMATCTPTFDASSIAVAVGSVPSNYTGPGYIKVSVYMGGVQVTESAYYGPAWTQGIVIGFRALSGAQVCKVTAHNYDGSSRNILGPATNNGNTTVWSIGVGSVKLA